MELDQREGAGFGPQYRIGGAGRLSACIANAGAPDAPGNATLTLLRLAWDWSPLGRSAGGGAPGRVAFMAVRDPNLALTP